MDNTLDLIQRWVITAIRQAAETPEMDLVADRPFLAIAPRASDDASDCEAYPVEELGSDRSARAAIVSLREASRRRGTRLCVELNEEAYPDLGPLLASEGFRLQWRHPLMACTPATFRPYSAPGVEVRFLEPTDSDVTLDTFQAVRRAGFGDVYRESAPAELERLRKSVARGPSRFALGQFNGRPAGSGVITPIDGVGEIVGIATLSELRRRGVAGTVTSTLVQSLFSAGGVLAWLDAADEVATALYSGLGFFRVGDRLSYVGP